MRWRARHPKVARLVDALVHIDARLERARTFGLAAEVAFYMFLSLVPLAAVAGLVAARVAVHHTGSIDPQLATLPPVLNTFIREQLKAVAAWNGGAVALPAAAVFVWLASSGVLSIFDALEVQTQSARAWWMKRLLAVGACVGLSIGVALVTILSTGAATLLRAVDGTVPLIAKVEASFLGALLRKLAGLAIAFGLMVGVYALGVPKVSLRRRVLLVPGAALATTLQAALAWGYSLYLSTLGKADAYSGALWTIGVTMTALYLFALTILFGAELNHWLAERRTRSSASTVRHAPSRLHHPARRLQ